MTWSNPACEKKPSEGKGGRGGEKKKEEGRNEKGPGNIALFFWMPWCVATPSKKNVPATKKKRRGRGGGKKRTGRFRRPFHWVVVRLSTRLPTREKKRKRKKRRGRGKKKKEKEEKRGGKERMGAPPPPPPIWSAGTELVSDCTKKKKEGEKRGGQGCNSPAIKTQLRIIPTFILP